MIYRLLAIILIIAVVGFMGYAFYQKNFTSNKVSTPSVDTQFITENYDTLISTPNSPEFVRALHENGFAVYHVGIIFPWDQQSVVQKKFADTTSAWRLAGRLELNRDCYGFLFLGNPMAQSHILDAGCGGGTSSILMDKIFNCYVDGYTLGNKEIKHAQATATLHNSSDKLRFFQGDILKLPEKDNVYDAIWISESSEYIASLSELFGEMKRVGKDGARMVMFTWTAAKDSGKKQMDDLYFTALHRVEEYLTVAKQHNLKLVHQQNLRDWVAPYFNFVVESKLYIEEMHLIQMFLTGELDYYLLCFDIQK